MWTAVPGTGEIAQVADYGGGAAARCAQVYERIYKTKSEGQQSVY